MPPGTSAIRPIGQWPGAHAGWMIRGVGADCDVVIVEDDAALREAMERVLHGVGYQVRSYASAEALRSGLHGAALGDSCRCVVCDVRLPGASGFDLLRHLRELGPLPPWIFITAHDSPAISQRARCEGAGYLPKPFLGRALLASVVAAMGSH